MPGSKLNWNQHHAMDVHLSEKFRLELSEKDITCRRICALKLVVRWLLGTSRTMVDLMRYAENAGATPSACVTRAMTDMCPVLQQPSQEDFTVKGNEITDVSGLV